MSGKLIQIQGVLTWKDIEAISREVGHSVWRAYRVRLLKPLTDDDGYIYAAGSTQLSAVLQPSKHWYLCTPSVCYNSDAKEGIDFEFLGEEED